MIEIAKESFLLVQALSIIILVSCILFLLLSWQFFYSVDAQDDGEGEDVNTDVNSFSVIIPEMLPGVKA